MNKRQRIKKDKEFQKFLKKENHLRIDNLSYIAIEKKDKPNFVLDFQLVRK